MEYGSGAPDRCSARPQRALSFDGFKVKAVSVLGRLTASPCARTRTSRPFSIMSQTNAVGFWGVYGVRPLTKTITLDAYYLGLDRKAATFTGFGHEVRATSYRMRVFLVPVAETKPGWDFDYEALWQFGTSVTQT